MDYRIPKINFLLVFFLLTLLKNYKIPSYYDYLLMFILVIAIAVNLFQLLRLKKITSGLDFYKIPVTFWVVSVIFLLLTSVYSRFGAVQGLIQLSFYYGPLLLISLYTYIKVKRSGTQYLNQFFRQFMVVMNFFSVMNLYQIIFNQPLLVGFLSEQMYIKQSWTIGTDAYRTISVFGNPIVAGLFFVVLFVCNVYFLKSGTLKIILQSVLLINIYSTDARSAWLALSIVLLLMFMHKLPTLQIKKLKISKKNLLPLYVAFCTLVAVLIFFMINFTQIVTTITDRFGDALTSNSTDISNLQRVGTIKLIFDNFQNDGFIQQLFGNGVFSAQSFMLQNTVAIKGFGTTDNQYMTWLYEFGLVGVVLIFIVIASLLLKLYKKPSNPIKNASFYGLITVLIIVFFFEGISPSWTDVSVILGILGVALSVRKDKQSEETVQ